MGLLYLRLLCVARKSSTVSQVNVNLHNICCGNGCHLTEECWLRCGLGEILLLFTGSVKMVQSTQSKMAALPTRSNLFTVITQKVLIHINDSI